MNSKEITAFIGVCLFRGKWYDFEKVGIGFSLNLKFFFG